MPWRGDRCAGVGSRIGAHIVTGIVVVIKVGITTVGIRVPPEVRMEEAKMWGECK